MINSIFKYKRTLLVFIHIIIGYFATIPFFSKLYVLSIFVYGTYLMFRTKNANEEALLLASYLVGAEVFARMTNGVILYETGKYGVAYFLLLGFFLGPVKNKLSSTYVVYILLLLLGIVFTQVPEGESLKNAIVFNLLGPLVLGLCSFYFFQRKITVKQLQMALFYMLLPTISMVVYLYFRTPSASEIIFGGVASFEASGGFGPNQVATAIGMGIFILTIFLLQRVRVSGYLLFDMLLLFYFIYRGLLTFSRGGIIAAFIAIILFLLFYIFSQRDAVKLLLNYAFVGVIFLVSVWVYTSNITGGMLDNRYTGRNASGVKKKDISSGRLAIFESQLQNFLENPLGIGVGNGKYQRLELSKHVTAASHNEVGRLIEEHGILGVIILILLFLFPLHNSLLFSNFQKSYLLSFFLLWFLTINHSAMRIAFPSFIYGLSLIHIISPKNE